MQSVLCNLRVCSFELIQESKMDKSQSLGESGQSKSRNFKFLKKLWCCISGKVKAKNLVLSNELIKVQGLMLKASAFQIFHHGNSIFINLFDTTNFSEQVSQSRVGLLLS